jgi:4,5-dihydroxyphthalate decarboxylase
MPQLKLSIATTDYDHFRDFRLGLVKAEGIEHNWQQGIAHRHFKPEEIFPEGMMTKVVI